MGDQQASYAALSNDIAKIAVVHIHPAFSGLIVLNAIGQSPNSRCDMNPSEYFLLAMAVIPADNCCRITDHTGTFMTM